MPAHSAGDARTRRTIVRHGVLRVDDLAAQRGRTFCLRGEGKAYRGGRGDRALHEDGVATTEVA